MQVCLVTGGNSGVGFSTSLELAKMGYHVYIACRSRKKALQTIQHIRQTTNNPNIEYIPLNLASLESVRNCANIFKQKNLPLHILINNAGIFYGKGVTQEGFELIWGTNYLGHFLLTYLLLDKLAESSPSRIIMVSSDLALKPTSVNWDLFIKQTPLNFIESYNQSKLCLLLLTQQLSQNFINRKITNITINAVHPGFVQSNITIGHQLSKYLGIGITPKQGSYPNILLATSPEFANITGKFFNQNGQEIPLPVLTQDQQLCQQLWEKSLLWTGSNQTIIQPMIKNQQHDDQDDQIYGPYSLKLNQEEITMICHDIFKNVLGKPPIKILLLQTLKSLLSLNFGSIILLLIQVYKRQFYMERHLDSDVIWKICQNQALLQVLKNYLGTEFQLWRSELWVNYPAHQLIPFWHKDIYPHLLSGKGKTVNVYIALTEVTSTNGFEYIPKHQINQCQIKISDPFSGNHFFEVPPAVEENAIPISLQPGEFILFTDELIHRSVYNTSGKVRLSLTLRVIQPSIKVISRYTSNFHQPVTLGNEISTTTNN